MRRYRMKKKRLPSPIRVLEVREYTQEEYEEYARNNPRASYDTLTEQEVKDLMAAMDKMEGDPSLLPDPRHEELI